VTAVQPIETVYRRHTFRSRLEARWAAFFDILGWDWTYEPIDCDYYIPDFTLDGGREVLVEVRPCTRYGELYAHAGRVEAALRGGCWTRDYLVVGARVGWAGEYDCFPVLGVLGDNMAGCGDCPDGWAVAPALWHRCMACGQLAFHHDEQSFASRPCGHYDGDGYLACTSLDELREMWGEAHRLTRWTR
jgi:hypothetical protein